MSSRVWVQKHARELKLETLNRLQVVGVTGICVSLCCVLCWTGDSWKWLQQLKPWLLQKQVLVDLSIYRCLCKFVDPNYMDVYRFTWINCRFLVCFFFSCDRLLYLSNQLNLLIILLLQWWPKLLLDETAATKIHWPRQQTICSTELQTHTNKYTHTHSTQQAHCAALFSPYSQRGHSKLISFPGNTSGAKVPRRLSREYKSVCWQGENTHTHARLYKHTQSRRQQCSQTSEINGVQF